VRKRERGCEKKQKGEWEEKKERVRRR
jgi:hypothetical protein